MNDPELVKSVAAFQQQKAKIKARQKVQLEDELEAWKADIGDNIKRVRKDKHASIQDVADIIGISNRTFIYDMIGASTRRQGKLPDVAEAPKHAYGENIVNALDLGYSIEFFDGVAKVSFSDDETYEVMIIDGEPEAPEAWGEHGTERRKLYRDILSEIRKHNG